MLLLKAVCISFNQDNTNDQCYVILKGFSKKISQKLKLGLLRF